MFGGFDCSYQMNSGINYTRPINDGIDYTRPINDGIDYARPINDGIDYTRQINENYNNMFIVNFKKYSTKQELFSKEMINKNVLIAIYLKKC